MMDYNTFEEELDAIRIKIYEEIKDMTHEEKVAYLKEETAPIREKFHIHTTVAPVVKTTTRQI
jgi:hypothetical protein